jgi:propanol-preferring alcohol dehydrogenase
VVEGDLELPLLPVTPGHQVVGRVDALGAGSTRFALGDRVGVTWLHRTDGECGYCRRGEENLCESADFTGWTVDGGYADALTVPEDFAVTLPDALDDLEAAPLLCAGVIGYRALRRAEVQRGDRVALLGFGARPPGAAGAPHWGCEVGAHRRAAPELARAGASWVGGGGVPPGTCDRAVCSPPRASWSPSRSRPYAPVAP